jgi:hypothetical protein
MPPSSDERCCSAYLDAHYGELTWKRPASYVWGMAWHTAGLYVLTQMVYQSMRESGKAPLLLLSFTYQKYLFVLTYAGLALHSSGSIWLNLLRWFSEDLIFALFISTTMSSSVVNFVLRFGWLRRWLEEDADLIPARPLRRRLRRRR